MIIHVFTSKLFLSDIFAAIINDIVTAEIS